LEETHVSDVERVVEQVDEDSTDGRQEGRARRRPPGADPEVRSFGAKRICAADGCETELSRYNPDSYCSLHRGWDRRVVHRQRRA
jgi:hypothetical protein